MGSPAPQANPDPDAWMATFAPFPLMYQPGERWLYNTGAEVLSVLVARASGSTLPDLLRERVLEPLGMRSTAFSVAAGEAGRFGPLWTPGEDGGDLALYDEADGQWSRPPAFPNGADGLVSTVDDLAAFGTMLLDGGVPAAGAQILAPTTMRAMTTARVPLGEDGGGWGLGLGVDMTDQPDGRHAGAYGWDGGLGTSWWNDPVTRTTAVLLTNLTWTSPAPPDHFWSFWRAARSEHEPGGGYWAAAMPRFSKTWSVAVERFIVMKWMPGAPSASSSWRQLGRDVHADLAHRRGVALHGLQPGR